ncbi:hypothetical protein BCR32DRAFT_159082 [Anaeromyces robustus]|uniref:DH domain-containing protein n=1 Tax=Anaeromyces robustus TaxID=1754192 RepID=A0A1Y1XAI5_9FUNG|nr:hypothetical protein BCR32DRAFT_159082 [Anaeromyces robustus]|eukprot:ORX82762.1 hypothetical protein BCR32DRAFT_159082 [Anaeromyces robustus]
MLKINQENVLKDLQIIRGKLNTATLEECIETLQLLVKSIFFLKEKKSDSCSEDEWNEYCKIRFNLGKHFVDIIRLYNERLSYHINEKYKLLVDGNSLLNINNARNPDEESEYRNPVRSDSLRNKRSNIDMRSYNTPNSVQDYNNLSPYTQQQINGEGPYSPFYNLPPSPNPSFPSHNNTYPLTYSPNMARHNNSVKSNNYPQTSNTYPYKSSSSNSIDNVNHSNSIQGRVTSSPSSSFNNDIGVPRLDSPAPHFTAADLHDTEIAHASSLTSHSLMTSSFSNAQEEDDNDDFGEESDNMIGQYYCTKEFKAKEDFQIDLQLNDIVTISQFTGKYILGKNCRTKAEGLFPIYYIESLDGNYVFFRCKEEMEFASVDDEIFLLREADNEYYPGYNITKGEQGIFNLNKLEPITLDENKRNEIENLYYEEQESEDSSRMNSFNTSLNEIFGNINPNALLDPLLPTNTITSNTNTNTNSNNSINESMMSFSPNITEEIRRYSVENKIDQNIVVKLLEYYKTIPELQDDDAFNKEKTNIDNNLDLMREAVKKFKEFRDIEEKEEKHSSKKDSFLSPQLFENVETKRKKWEANRYRCLELIETEKSYCDKMKIMIEKFMKPLEAAADTENEMLNRVQISLIFKNIPDIYEFSYKLHKELAEAFTHYDEEGPIPIATVFLNKFSDWKIYIKYVEDFHTASATLENLKRSPQTDRYNRFMEQCERSKECNQMNLKDLIVLPVQRFLKYRLLFEGIKKDSDPRNKESYQLLDTVENYIFEIGEIMNDAKKIQENINKMFLLEKTIMNYPPDLISYTQRSFIDEWGYKDINYKEKRLYLFSDTLLFASLYTKKVKKGKKYKYVFERRIDILDYDVEKKSGTSNRLIKFVETSRYKNSKSNSAKVKSHTHSRLNFGIMGSHSTGYSVPVTKALIFFDNEEACNNFCAKYQEQKVNLLKENLKKAKITNRK